jgi:hypothetical protein
MTELSKGKKSKKQTNPSPPQYMLDIEARLAFCRANYTWVTGMIKAGLLPERQFPHNSAETRFSRRFADYARIYQPTPLSYEKFNTSIDLKAEPEEIYASASSYFAQAKSLFEKFPHKQGLSPLWIDEYKALLKGCVTSSVALHMHKTKRVNVAADGALKLQIDASGIPLILPK